MVDIEYVKKHCWMLCCISITACTSTGQINQKSDVPVEERSVTVDKQDSQKQISIDETALPETEIANKSIPDTVEQQKQTIEDENLVTSPAIVALLDDVDQYEHSGKPNEAAATLERALRIEPKNPLLWQRLGALHLRQGDWQQAIAMAKKSNFLAADNKKLQLINWKIIEQASVEQGDKKQLMQAQKMIRSLSN